MKTREEINEIFEQAKKGTLPTDFKDWDLADNTGWTVAHEYAKYHNLPDGFD